LRRNGFEEMLLDLLELWLQQKSVRQGGTNFVPALPNAFHSFGLMIRSYSRTYFFWMTLSMW